MFLDDLEQFEAGPLLPAVITGVFGVGRNPTILVKAPKMIDPDHVIELETCSQAGKPPGITLLGVAFPSVKRISPELPIGGKIVGRNSGDAGGSKIFRHLEKLRMSPNVGAIHCDKNRDITKNLDLPISRVPSQFVPLLEKPKLMEGVGRGFVFQLFGFKSALGQGIALCFRRPLLPGTAIKLRLD